LEKNSETTSRRTEAISETTDGLKYLKQPCGFYSAKYQVPIHIPTKKNLQNQQSNVLCGKETRKLFSKATTTGRKRRRRGTR
jgi:hypothetical protein